MHSICAVGGALKPESKLLRQASEVGLLCQFAARLPSHQQMPLPGFMSLAMATQQVGQLKVYLNGYEECVGYVMWALLTPDVEREFISGKPRALADWEYSDGTSAWILDMAVAPGSLPHVLQDLRDVVFKDQEQLTYFRVKGGRRMCKRVSRADRSSFMAAGRRVQA
ncbi:toxin-activating lysine-acyltransferase [Roseateles sp. LYH14W]|uniref:RTX toxin-activating lysine-acyltransferase n=1 Tax=Pelomonas parva TaxID=3299032 RepID=A0ABW7F072_9BURK